jgi:hypothetical protein
MRRNGLSSDQKIAVVQERRQALPQLTQPQAAEQFYTVKEVARILRYSEDKVREIFADEPGVFVERSPGTKYKRAYTTLRIPDTVLQRVIRRMSNV